MNQSNFGDIRVFVEVARRGGFRTAAEHLQRAPASISEAVRRLENGLGVRLFERSTRSVALTALGEQFYRQSLPAVADLEAAIRDLDDHKDDVTGTLHLSAPYSAGPFFLDDLVARFAVAHPAVDIEIIYDDQKVDLLTSGVDAVVRSSSLLAPDTYAVPVGPELTMSIVAAPEYLARNGKPQHPQDVADHDAICYSFGMGGPLAPWQFQGQEGPFILQPQPRMVANDMRAMLRYAELGLGQAYVYGEIAAAYVVKGGLVEVLADHLSPLPRYSLNYRSKRHMTRRLKSFIDMAKADATPDTNESSST